MDKNGSVLQVERGVGSFDGFHHLKAINEDNTSPERLGWMWKQLSQCEYAFDDFTRGKIDFFLEQFTTEVNEFFELDDAGLIVIQAAIPAGNVTVHFMIWDRVGYGISQQRNAGKELFDFLFYNKRVHHIIGMIPSFNQHSVRLASSLGMRFEGEIRESFLYKGKYFNHLIYGILESEYRIRRGRL